MGLKQNFYINNNKREQAVTFLQKQTIKIKQFKKLINLLPNLASVKPDLFLLSFEKLIFQRGLRFIHALSLQANNLRFSKSRQSI